MSKKRKISSSDNEEPEEQIEANEKTVTGSENKSQPISGVIYLSRIPNKMNVTIVRSYFDQYGQTGRIYLQLSSKSSSYFLIELLVLFPLFRK